MSATFWDDPDFLREHIEDLETEIADRRYEGRDIPDALREALADARRLLASATPALPEEVAQRDSWPCETCGSGEHNTLQHGSGFSAEQHEWEQSS